ncbi:hypothetical protein [Aegicerativicinus sediminis]|uniref:hypothetical protein n=1 Tax=Aegicerativicinus sediminis TaxID=2893202 RepID=UPI001E605774|nr:hypothetical protein [Aegicerativicinus sediminis]
MGEVDKPVRGTVNIVNHIMMQWVLLIVTLSIFIAVNVAFIYMLVKGFDWEKTVVAGGADIGYMVILKRITDSLFKVEK